MHDKRIYMKHKFVKNIFYYSIFLASLCTQFLYAQTILPAVTFFPEKTVHLDVRDHRFHKLVNAYILNNLKAEGLRLSVAPIAHKSDYYLTLDHALGCPNLGEDNLCHIMIVWNMYRADHAPVISWTALYRLNVPIEYQKKRFIGFEIPREIIARTGDDFVRSLIFETLKNQKYDYVYIMPDRLEDATTLCSADTLQHAYELAGLYVTDKISQARFLIKTKINSVQEDNISKLFIRRVILDRLTGEYKIFPIKSSIIEDFLYEDAYDCAGSAAITMKNIGIFIDNAP